MLRISRSTYNRMTNEALLANRYEQLMLNEQINTMQKVNKPSQNVVASSLSQGANRTLNELNQYAVNLGNNQTWLQQASATMQSISILMIQLKERAEQMSTGTYSAEQRETISSFADQVFQLLINHANVQVDGKHIFAGTRNNIQAASNKAMCETPAHIIDNLGGTGQLYGQGTYTGLLSRTIDLQVIQAPPAGTAIDAANPLVLSYSYFDDLGRQKQGEVTLTGTGTGRGVDLGDGVQIYADPGTIFVEGAQYQLEVGRHTGNDQALYGNLSWGDKQQYNYVLNQIFQIQGYTGTEAMMTIASGRNSVLTTGALAINGESSYLQQLNMSVVVGGPFQSTQTNAQLLADRGYTLTVDPGYAGGVPSAAYPLLVNYQYTDALGVVQNDQVTITGTGPGNTVLLEPAGEAQVFMSLTLPIQLASLLLFPIM